MSTYNPLDADADPFRPPEIPTLVGCLHCGQEYESFLIEWRVLRDSDGKPHGFWCCPMDGCDGRGFGFDILPVDPNYQDERGGWVHDDEEDDDNDFEQLDETDPLAEDDDSEKKGKDDETDIPF